MCTGKGGRAGEREKHGKSTEEGGGEEVTTSQPTAAMYLEEEIVASMKLSDSCTSKQVQRTQ